MADFGNAGTRTVRKYTAAVKVAVTQAEYLSFKLTTQGAIPEFTFSCAHRSLRAAADFPGHPKAVYEWKWPEKATDKDDDDDVYGVRMAFITAKKYTLEVKHHRTEGTVQLLIDVDYASNDPTDWYQETIRVLAV